MVVHAFPIAKLGALLVKQVSKPIAKFCQESAKSSPVFRKYVCIPPATVYNWCEVKMKMWILNLGKPVNIPVLNEAMAIELGASLLGEAVIFIIASGILIAEYTRSARKEERKEQEIKAEKKKLNEALQDLYFMTQKQDTQIRELTRKIYEMEGKVVQKSWMKKGDEKSEPPPTSPPPLVPKSELLVNIISEEVGEMEVNTKEEEHKIIELVENKKHAMKEEGSLLMRAVALVEKDFWLQQDQERDVGVLTAAINHLYKDVYRIPLRL
ncbi:PREDICTED: putative OPA3-like protein CG13603 isoform X1 [Nicrophorus vespilloides]|uniref:OPA3-like protein CG13603 isoform X1 n=1 Tax=Nicrophorus vespilloides TaxID=110193 RepID=A0ABM1MMQ9_NICVS|nr:PREDICTED: putative OPA3-like protein CG13603 isoform X1 [Nicrophorus vespilloides]